MSKRLNRILNSQSAIIGNNVDTRGFRAGKTFAEIDSVYRAGKGVCAICSQPRGARNLSLDHDHATGRLRGVLCHKCNVGLGHFNDDVSLMAQAIEYINKYK